MDYYSYYLKHCYYWLYCIYMPSDNEFVACVDRKKSYGTPLVHMIQQNEKSSSSISSVRVRVSSRSSSSSSSGDSTRSSSIVTLAA